MYNSTTEYEVSILVNGRPIPEVLFYGRTYVEGRKNSQYSLQVRNNTGRRILAIPSVDGLNVLNGETCGVESPGYVIEAHSSIVIPGWKVAGTQEAGRFVFKPQGARYAEDETYAESTGRPENQGTIGFMIFPEKEIVCKSPPVYRPDPWKPHPFGPVYSSNVGSNTTKRRGSAAKSYTSTTSGTLGAGEVYSGEVHDGQASMDCNYVEDENALGTGWGEAVEFHTHGVAFQRADPVNPAVTFVFYYDTIRNLRRLGVPVEQFYGRKSSPHEANPFPASPHVTGGCRPPSGWQGRKKRRGRGR